MPNLVEIGSRGSSGEFNNNNNNVAAVILLFYQFSCLRLCAGGPKNND